MRWWNAGRSVSAASVVYRRNGGVRRLGDRPSGIGGDDLRRGEARQVERPEAN